MKALILAGGSGKRLWPLSSDDNPKQFLSINQEDSLLEQTVRRLSGHDLLVIGNRKHTPLIQEQLGASFGDAILIEPEARSTAPAILLGIKYLLEKCGASKEEVCIVCPSDHYFETEEDLLRLLPSAEEGAKSGAIVTFGITPTYPETGYGYIKAVEGKGMREVERFVEKPNFETATRFLEKGGYYWNAGIFVFQIGLFLEEIKSHAPLLFDWFQLPYEKGIESFSSLPSISIDHALMEKTERLLLIPYPSVWSDLGSWERLDAILPKDREGNFLSGKSEAIDTTDSMIFGEDITLLGVKDIVVVKKGEKVVVCSKKELHRLPQLQQTESYSAKEK